MFHIAEESDAMKNDFHSWQIGILILVSLTIQTLKTYTWWWWIFSWSFFQVAWFYVYRKKSVPSRWWVYGLNIALLLLLIITDITFYKKTTKWIALLLGGCYKHSTIMMLTLLAPVPRCYNLVHRSFLTPGRVTFVKFPTEVKTIDNHVIIT